MLHMMEYFGIPAAPYIRRIFFIYLVYGVRHGRERLINKHYYTNKIFNDRQEPVGRQNESCTPWP